jgi:hypothetical protein
MLGLGQPVLLDIKPVELLAAGGEKYANLWSEPHETMKPF